MRVLVYHNPGAGHDDVPAEALTDDLQRAGHELVWLEKGQGAIALAAEGVEAVVVVGGDGSVGKVARELVDRSIPILIVPRGTANNIATHLGCSAAGVGALLTRGRRRLFDIGVISGVEGRRVFLEGVGFGPFATTAAVLEHHEGRPETVRNRDDELKRDLSALRECVLAAEPPHSRLAVDETELEGRHLMVEVLNIPAVGPNLLLAPEADSADGQLDVVVVDVVEREDLAAFVQARLKESARPGFAVRRGRHVRLSLPAGVHLHIDDEVVHTRASLELDIGIRPGGLTFITS